jgi:Transposase
MDYWVGFDVGKRFHWLCVLDGDGAVLLSKRVDATEEHLEVACSEIAALGDVEERVIGVDVLGGPATLLETILLERAASEYATSPERLSTKSATPTPAANIRVIPRMPSSSPTS